jgi:nitrogen permease regulator 3-like protein
MTVVAPPPNPSLVAIILVVQARSGPRFVYHYPPSPLSKSASNRFEGGPSPYDDSTSSDEESTSASEEEVSSDTHGRGWTKPKRANLTDEEAEDSSSPGTDDERHGGWRVPWEHLLDLDANALERLLMPSDRSWHKRRFEVGFNELVFVGWPIFMREDGTWRKERRKEKVPSDKAQSVAVNRGPEVLPEGKHDSQDPIANLGQTDLAPSVPTDIESDLREESREMTIFNVVFVLNPPILEYSLRVKEMYDHVVKKLGRALKREQARTNYVWKQSEIILEAKAQARHKSLLSRFSFPSFSMLRTV